MPFGVLCGVPNAITHAKFDVNQLRGSAAAPLKMPFHILIRTTPTTALLYCADCNIVFRSGILIL